MSILSMMRGIAKTEGLKFSPLPDYGDLMSWEDFLGTCKCGGFIDYDGHGNFCRGATEESNQMIYPSEAVDPDFKPPEWATHVLWFNR